MIRRFQRRAPLLGVGLLIDDPCSTIDVAEHEVTIDPIADAKSAFDMHFVAVREQAKVRAVERFLDRIEAEHAIGHLSDGEAHAVDRDAFAMADVIPGRVQREPAELGAVYDADATSDLWDQFIDRITGGARSGRATRDSGHPTR